MIDMLMAIVFAVGAGFFALGLSHAFAERRRQVASRAVLRRAARG